MNAGRLILNSLGATKTAKSAACRPATSKRTCAVPKSTSHTTRPSLYSTTFYRTIFGFSFAPKQKEPAITDGLDSAGVAKTFGAEEDTSDQFNKNPIYLTKSDAKEEYGFFRKPTTTGTE